MISYALTIERLRPKFRLQGYAKVQPLGEASRLTLVTSPGLEWLAGRRTLLIGQLFERASGRALDHGSMLDEAAGQGFNAFLRQFHGRYLLIHDAGDGVIQLLRDPSGAIPCYRTRHGDLFLSDAAIGRAMGLLQQPVIDPIFLAHWLQFPFLRSPRTGITDILELTPGASISIGEDKPRETQCWRPTLLPTPHWQEAEKAAAAVRRTAMTSVNTVCGNKLTLIQMSGGLDSSILAACLAAKGHPMRGISFATSSPDGDERHHAMAVANHLGIPLHSIHENDAQRQSVPQPSFRPGINIILDAIDRAIEEYRCEIGAAMVVDGGGGDSLFGYSRTAAPILDAFREGHGWATLQSVSERSSVSLWRAAEVSLRQWLRQRSGWQENRDFLGEAAGSASEDLHPWLVGGNQLQRGKEEHLVSLVHIQHFLDRHTIGGDHRHPLMNQPLIELCLSIPSWMWNGDGQDRAIARRAFRNALPQSITARRTKGSLQGYFHRRFRTLLPELRPLLLEGELAMSGITDRAALERALASDGIFADDRAMRLSEIATLERWLGVWRNNGAR